MMNLTKRVLSPYSFQGSVGRTGLQAEARRGPYVRACSCVASFAVIVLSIGALSQAFASSQDRIAWVTADNYANKDSNPRQYWPGNIFDNNNSTVWCVEGGARGARSATIHVGFKTSVEIDRISVNTGDWRSQSSFEEHNRVTRLVVNDGRYRRTVNLDDKRERQVSQFSTPIRGHHLVITIEGIQGNTDKTCISGIVFQQENRSLNGSWMAGNLSYDPARSPLLGIWAGGNFGAPERFLTFYIDNTYRYLYSPHDPAEEGFDINGAYRVSGGSVQLRIENAWRSVNVRREQGEDDFGNASNLLIISDADEEIEHMNGNWNAWRR